MIDRHPGAGGARRGAADVIEAVRFARDEIFSVAVRGGGHNIAGNAVCDGGLLIDLSRMQLGARRSRAAHGAGRAGRDAGRFRPRDAGVRPRDAARDQLDDRRRRPDARRRLRLATRKFGLTIDNLLCGRRRHGRGRVGARQREENPDLFWALRGGGGNFGVVTSFEFRLHPLGPQVLSGLVVHPFDAAAELLPQYRRSPTRRRMS